MRAASVEANGWVSPRTAAGRRSIAGPIGSAALGAFGALILLAPFEATRPLIQLPSQSVSTTEALLLLALVLGGLAHVAARRSFASVGAGAAPVVTLVAVAVVAALVAPESRGNALHMAARLTLACGVYVLTLTLLTKPLLIERATWLLCASGVVVAGLAVLEYAEVPVVLSWLKHFRPSVSLIGAQIRAAGPLQYPTIASMYLEMCFACGLGLLGLAIVRRQRRQTLLMVLLLALVLEGIVVTFTRSGLITAVVSLCIVGAMSVTRGASPGVIPAIVVLTAVGVIEVLYSRSNEAIVARMSAEGQEGWYRAAIDAPAVLSLRTGATTSVPIRLTNHGLVTWDPDAAQPFRVAYHWLEADSTRVVEWEGLRTALPRPIGPGQQVDLMVNVASPTTPGDYRIAWDVEQANRLWFSTEPEATLAVSAAQIAGAAVAPRRSSRLFLMPTRAVRPGRQVLWRAAGAMLAEHPLTGVGPDNYRLMYGRYAHLPKADVRIHSNNSYLEFVVGTGVGGVLALAWLASQLVSRIRAALESRDPLSAGLLAGVVAIALHGLVDSFLGFTPTYVVMAVVFGLFTLVTRSGEAHAHRV